MAENYTLTPAGHDDYARIIEARLDRLTEARHVAHAERSSALSVMREAQTMEHAASRRIRDLTEAIDEAERDLDRATGSL